MKPRVVLFSFTIFVCMNGCGVLYLAFRGLMSEHMPIFRNICTICIHYVSYTCYKLFIRSSVMESNDCFFFFRIFETKAAYS